MDANAKDVRLYAPLILSRCRRTGRTVAHMPAEPMAYCSSPMSIGTLYDVPSRKDMLERTGLDRRVDDWARQHSARLASMISFVRRRLMAYQQAAANEHGVQIDIDWEAVAKNLREMAYRGSSSSSSSSSFHQHRDVTGHDSSSAKSSLRSSKAAFRQTVAC